MTANLSLSTFLSRCIAVSLFSRGLQRSHFLSLSLSNGRSLYPTLTFPPFSLSVTFFPIPPLLDPPLFSIPLFPGSFFCFRYFTFSLFLFSPSLFLPFPSYLFLLCSQSFFFSLSLFFAISLPLSLPSLPLFFLIYFPLSLFIFPPSLLLFFFFDIVPSFSL